MRRPKQFTTSITHDSNCKLHHYILPAMHVITYIYIYIYVALFITVCSCLLIFCLQTCVPLHLPVWTGSFQFPVAAQPHLKEGVMLWVEARCSRARNNTPCYEDNNSKIVKEQQRQTVNNWLTPTYGATFLQTKGIKDHHYAGVIWRLEEVHFTNTVSSFIIKQNPLLNFLKGGSSIATSMIFDESPDRMLYY